MIVETKHFSIGSEVWFFYGERNCGARVFNGYIKSVVIESDGPLYVVDDREKVGYKKKEDVFETRLALETYLKG